MTRLWTFEHKDGNSDKFETSMKVWRTLSGATQAANKWRSVMQSLDCPSQTRVCELIPEGSTRRIQPTE